MNKKTVQLTGDLAAGAPVKVVKVLGEFGMTQEQVDALSAALEVEEAQVRKISNLPRHNL